MIELIYNEEEKYTAEEKHLGEPKNVKQIGEPTEYKKIFIEDYVHTFLLQICKEQADDGKVAILFGQTKRSGGMRHIYVKSALPVDGVVQKQGKYLFSEKASYSHHQRKKHPSGDFRGGLRACIPAR